MIKVLTHSRRNPIGESITALLYCSLNIISKVLRDVNMFFEPFSVFLIFYIPQNRLPGLIGRRLSLHIILQSNRMNLLFFVKVCSVDADLSVTALFEEVNSYLREHSIGQHVLLLLCPLCTLCLERLKLRLK